MKHTCHWPGCAIEVDPKMWGCLQHWFALPRALRNRIWATYRPGQEVTKTPSAAYVAAAKAVQEWIKQDRAQKTQAEAVKAARGEVKPTASGDLFGGA